MAATLSAEEEQVGLDTYFVLGFFVLACVLFPRSRRGWEKNMSDIAAAPGGIRVARTEAIRRWRCAMDLLRNGPREPRAEMLDRFLALVATLALVAPPPVPLSAGPGLAGMGGGKEGGGGSPPSSLRRREIFMLVLRRVAGAPRRFALRPPHLHGMTVELGLVMWQRGTV